MIIQPSEKAITEAAARLRAGELVAFPTETVYGLGADATNESAARKIFEIKGRPATNPLIVHVDSIERLLRYVDLSRSKNPKLLEQRLVALRPAWPGPLSVIVPKSSAITSAVSAGGDTVALRIPNHPVALQLLRACGLPIAAPSANPSMYVSPTTAQHVLDGLGSSVAYILDGGPCQVGIESTVLSLIDETPRILRPGAVTASDLQKLLGCSVEEWAPLTGDERETLLSPGLLEKHYSPRTPVVLRTNITPLTKLPPKVGCILFADHAAPCAAVTIKIISDTGDLAEIAAQLFAALRELDHAGLDLIVIDTCEPIGLGAAIMDRLIRASASTRSTEK